MKAISFIVYVARKFIANAALGIQITASGVRVPFRIKRQVIQPANLHPCFSDRDE